MQGGETLPEGCDLSFPRGGGIIAARSGSVSAWIDSRSLARRCCTLSLSEKSGRFQVLFVVRPQEPDAGLDF